MVRIVNALAADVAALDNARAAFLHHFPDQAVLHRFTGLDPAAEQVPVPLAKARLRTAAPGSWILHRVFSATEAGSAADRRAMRRLSPLTPGPARNWREFAVRPRERIQVLQALQTGGEACKAGGPSADRSAVLGRHTGNLAYRHQEIIDLQAEFRLVLAAGDPVGLHDEVGGVEPL